MWREIGFRENPYSPRPIQGNEEGVELLVGRDDELRMLMTYIKSSDTHPTLEGPNGVGKTSLVSVAGYKLQKDFEDGKSAAFIPLQSPFQLTNEDTLRSFKQKVLFAVAQQFIKSYKLLYNCGYKIPAIKDVNSWLNSPLFLQSGGGASIAGFGGNVTRSTTPNSSSGFTESGFSSIVQTWLSECFTSRTAGAFICVIDNLELLETSKRARDLLESIRDEILNVIGLRWVLCGARGIVRSSASSPRLQGVLAEPISIDPINDSNAEAALIKRINVYSIGVSNPPVEADGFTHIYRIGNRNLRNALKFCEDFSMWAYLKGQLRDESSSLSTPIFDLFS